MPVSAVKSKNRSQPFWGNYPPLFAERLHGAIDYLNFKVRHRNALAACQTIEKIVAEQCKYRFFKKFFPVEWKCSRTSLFKAGYYENYSERVNELFNLISNNMFPLVNDWNDDPDADFENFYIFSLNLDTCCEDLDYENLRVSYVAALLFFFRAEEIWEYFAKNYQIKRADFPEMNERPHENLWKAETTGNVGLYRHIFELVDHSTGNPWLDATNCGYGDWYPWDEETLEFLTESYREAQNILEKTTFLDDLIEANAGEILLEMVSLWNDGQISKVEKRCGGQSAENNGLL